MLGAAVGSFEKIYFPHLTGSIGSYALVGMGVLFAAFLRAPLTSVFMVLEVSGNYSIVLPVILANTIAYVISRVTQPIPIFEELTHQDGLYLPSMEELREESNLRLEDAMQPVTVPVLQGSETIPDTVKSLARYEDSKTAPVVLIHCRDGLWYAARREELDALFSDSTAAIAEESSIVIGTERSSQTLEERLGSERTPILFPDLPLSSALPHFQRWPLLPVTNRAMRGSLEGVVSLQDVLNRYHQQTEHTH
jgi:CIC family chloride channel protein